MTIYRGVGGVNREIKQQFRGVGGVNREIKEQHRGVGGVNRKVFNYNPYPEGVTPVYWLGDEIVDLTGGFNQYFSKGYGGIFQRNDDNMLFGDNDTSSSIVNMNISTENKIDVTDFTTMHLDYEVVHNYTPAAKNSFGVRLLKTQTEPWTSTLTAFIEYYGSAVSVARTTQSLNISNISGSYYVAGFDSCNTDSSQQIYGKIYRIWFE